MLPAGPGRSDPNTNPTLPKPVGRLRFTLNPFVMMFRLLGPKLCRRISCVLCSFLCVLVLYYMVPVIFANVVTGNVGGLFNRFLVTVGQMNSEDFGCWFVNTLWRLPKKA